MVETLIRDITYQPLSAELWLNFLTTSPTLVKYSLPAKILSTGDSSPNALFEIVWWGNIIAHRRASMVNTREKFCALGLKLVPCMWCSASACDHVLTSTYLRASVLCTTVYGLVDGIGKHTQEIHLDVVDTPTHQYVNPKGQLLVPIPRVRNDILSPLNTWFNPLLPSLLAKQLH